MKLALKIVSLLRDHGAVPGTEIATQEALEWWLEAEGRTDVETFYVGLAEAAIEGWVISRATGEIRITEAGTAAVHRTMN